MSNRALRRTVLTLALTSAALLLMGVGQAFAGMPWWHLTTISSPPHETGGEAQVIVEASNLGDGVANELNSPITVKDTLPSGVMATNVAGQGNGISAGEGFYQEESATCSVPARTVSCQFPKRVGPYERVILVIDVKVTPGSGGGVNNAKVSGGFAPTVESRRALALEGPPPSFGVQTWELTPEQEGGAADTLAGSHPFQLTSTLVLNTQAEPKLDGLGKHRLMSVPMALTKDLRFALPPGLIGNPTPIPKCSVYMFSQEAKGVAGFKCPDDTIVGVASTMVDPSCCVGHAPLALAAPLYSLEPAAGEPARFGFRTPINTPVILDTGVRTGEGYGVEVSVTNITQLAAFMASQVTFWGSPSDHRHDGQRGQSCLDVIAQPEPKFPNGGEVFCPLGEAEQPFLIMPTVCSGVPVTSVEADSWSAPGAMSSKEYAFQNGAGEPLPFDGCNKLSFEPAINVNPDGQQASSPTGLTVDVHVPQEASLNLNGRAESAVKSITVMLPEGVAVDPSGAEGLQTCSEAQIGLKDRAEPACPEASQLASVTIHTPLLPHALEGSVYLASQNANPFGSLVAMYLVAKDPVSGVLVKLAGKTSLCEAAGEVIEGQTCGVAGQIVSTFENPPLPFEDAELHFHGGSSAPLATPAMCREETPEYPGGYFTHATLVPWAENGDANVLSPPFSITSGPRTQVQPGGTPCPGGGLPFAPTLTGGSLNINAGAFTPLTGTFGREDGEQQIARVHFTLPPGLSGVLSNVQLCGEADANAGSCGPGSLIGETTVAAGFGSDPIVVYGGKVYLTGPYRGAPFGLSIVDPVKAGPFDLEHDTSKPATNMPACDCVVVRGKLEVDPVTAQVTITTNKESEGYAIPHFIDGIPVQLKRVNFVTTRHEFQFNPTNCSKMAITGTAESAEGTTRPVEVPFQVTNCKDLAFKPSFKVSTAGKTSRKNGASLHVTLTYPKAAFGSQANIRYVKVALPRQLPSRLETLQKACTDKVFDANPAGCPAASKIGTVTATTPLLPVPLTGPVYFVSHAAVKFPDLVAVLQGYGVTIDLRGETFIAKNGQTSTTFRTIPDAPVGTFEMDLPQGPFSALAAPTGVCNATKTVLVAKRVRFGGRTVTRKVRKTVAAPLTMPTRMIAQNGAVFTQTTRIKAVGCPRHVTAGGKAKKKQGKSKGKRKR